MWGTWVGFMPAANPSNPRGSVRKRCPECGQPVKEENLAEHLGRVHPNLPRRRYKELQIAKPQNVRSGSRGWVPYAVVIVAVTLGAGLFFASGQGPAFYADHLRYDLGHVSQTTVEHSFSFENRGEKDLRVWGISSSCDCTSAHVIIGGVQGPHIGMHTEGTWEGRIPPGASATLVAVYDATQMPDLYVGSREIYVRTNDPAQSMVTFTILVDER